MVDDERNGGKKNEINKPFDVINMDDVIDDGIALRAHASLVRGGVTNDDNDNGIGCKYTASKCDYVSTYFQ